MLIHHHCTYYYAYYDFPFPFAGHNDRVVIFESAAYYALSDEDLGETVSCNQEPVLHQRDGVCTRVHSVHLHSRGVLMAQVSTLRVEIFRSAHLF